MAMQEVLDIDHFVSNTQIKQMMRKIKGNCMRGFFMGLLILFLAHTGYSKEKQHEKITPVDYSIADHWLSLPAPVKAVDVFYVYPTVWGNKSTPHNPKAPGDPEATPHVCTINNTSMVKGACLTFETQAKAFETVGNIYAPYYRQANVPSIMGHVEKEPLHDVTAAFDYYIKHFNHGRPFILAAHSQGSGILMLLLPDIAKKPELYNRMIAAYLIGGHIQQSFLDKANKELPDKTQKLKFATGPNDTGVIISFNTRSPSWRDANTRKNQEPDLVINPMTWTRDEAVATIAQGGGSLMPNGADLGHFSNVSQYADARVDIKNGLLICSTSAESYSADIKTPEGISVNFAALGPGNYHMFDYWFYYYNIRENAENRVNKFLGK